MTPEVKRRIEQIRLGIVPEGYKRTKAGIVPIEWEERTLGSIYAERKEPGNNKLPILTVSIRSGVSDGELDEDEIGKKVRRIEDRTQYRKALSGDLVFNMMRAWQGAIGVVRADGMVSPAYIVATPNKSVYPLFMDYYMKTPQMVNTIHRASYGLTDFRLRLYWASFALICCAIPSVAEQQKIAAILTTQDRVIELTQRKIEELKKIKKIFLSKMFPKKGQIVPEIRFMGFTDAWEQRKLKDLCSIFSDGDWIEAKDQSESGIRLIQTGNVGVTEFFDKPNNKKWVSQETFERLHCTEVLSGDILISRLPEPAGRACIVPKIGQKMITAVDCTIVRVAPDYSPKYIVQYLATPSYFNVVNQCLAGGTRQRISRGNLSDFLVPIPISKAEQEQIGTLLQSLDDLITLHQRKLEEEKKKKKALIQLLLTGIVRVQA